MTTTAFDFDHARFNMIEQQIRPWEVLDPSILELLSAVRREDFVPEALRTQAFTDTELPLLVDGKPTGEVMLAPKVEARLLQAAAIKTHDTVLEIGAGSGYMAALAAHRARHVITVEIQAPLVRLAQAHLQRAGVHNVVVEHGDGIQGELSADAPDHFDVIFLSGAVPSVPQHLLEDLNLGGRMVAIVGAAPVMSAQLITRVSKEAFDTVTLFETLTLPLVQVAPPSQFKF